MWKNKLAAKKPTDTPEIFDYDHAFIINKDKQLIQKTTTLSRSPQKQTKFMPLKKEISPEQKQIIQTQNASSPKPKIRSSPGYSPVSKQFETYQKIQKERQQRLLQFSYQSNNK